MHIKSLTTNLCTMYKATGLELSNSEAVALTIEKLAIHGMNCNFRF
jgi:hypothetical protein